MRWRPRPALLNVIYGSDVSVCVKPAAESSVPATHSVIVGHRPSAEEVSTALTYGPQGTEGGQEETKSSCCEVVYELSHAAEWWPGVCGGGPALGLTVALSPRGLQAEGSVTFTSGDTRVRVTENSRNPAFCFVWAPLLVTRRTLGCDRPRGLRWACKRAGHFWGQ